MDYMLPDLIFSSRTAWSPCRSSRSRMPVTAVTCEGASVPGFVTGVGWSDPWSFWQCGYPAVMVTDTAPFRYPHYHTPEDTPDKMDYPRMALVVAGLRRVVEEVAQGAH